MNRRTSPLPVTLLLALPALCAAAACSGEPSPDAGPDAAPSQPPAVAPLELGAVKNVHTCGDDMLLAGQPTEADLALLAARGVKRVVDLRTEGEVPWDEPAAVQANGMEYVRVPFREADELDDAELDALRGYMREADEAPLFLHCGSANRVGGVWLAWRVLDVGDGVSFDDALAEAREIGLRSDALAERVRAYVDARRER